MKIKLFITSYIAIFILAGCSKLILVEEPQMRVLGGKTLIEAQVLGRYRQIDEAAYQLSVLSSGYDATSLIAVSSNVSPEENTLYKNALIRSMFNEDEIILYKKNHYIGENNKGYLDYIKEDIAANSQDLYGADRINHIKNLIKEENSDRKTVAEYLILTDPKLTMLNITEVESALYKRNIERLENGIYFQLPDSVWTIYTNTKK